MQPKKYRNRRKLDLSFAKFFNPSKSPHTQWTIDPLTGLVRFNYQAKNSKLKPYKLIHDSRKGTYVARRVAPKTAA